MPALKKKSLTELTWKSIAPPYLDFEYFADCRKVPFRHRAHLFDLANAWWLAECSTLAYADDDFVIQQLDRTDLDDVRFFKGKITQCFVANNSRCVIVAFRGSELRKRPGENDLSNVFADWLTNFRFVPVDWGQRGKVHQGFKAALDEVWQELSGYLDTLKDRRRTVWVTGHSMGAAVATLAADRYGNVRGLYTYGSPRVGDADFRSDYFVDTYRFVNNKDIVAKVPPQTLYVHVGNLKFIDAYGVLRDNELRWGRWADDLEDKVRNMFSSLGRMEPGFSGFVPDAVKDHAPTLYAIHIWNALVELQNH
ncbi:MAG: lipase family protein [Deltaproteobacteria bacterium]|nr:lipase family protein [Deltaproteobacteria bacterium]